MNPVNPRVPNMKYMCGSGFNDDGAERANITFVLVVAPGALLGL